jgi:hypothetical protein
MDSRSGLAVSFIGKPQQAYFLNLALTHVMVTLAEFTGKGSPSNAPGFSA